MEHPLQDSVLDYLIFAERARLIVGTMQRTATLRLARRLGRRRPLRRFGLELEFLDDFLRDDLQNPGDDTVGSAFADRKAVAVNYARPHI